MGIIKKIDITQKVVEIFKRRMLFLVDLSNLYKNDLNDDSRGMRG